MKPTHQVANRSRTLIALAAAVLAAVTVTEVTPAAGAPPHTATIAAISGARNDHVRAASFTPIAPGVSLAAAYGNPAKTAHGAWIRFAAGAVVPLHHYTSPLRGVLISGRFVNQVRGVRSTRAPLQPGDLFTVPAGAEHIDHCIGPATCLIYTYQDAAFMPVFP